MLFINHVSFLGGAERNLLSLIEALDQKFKVFFICQEPGPLPEALKKIGVVVEYMPLGAWRKPINIIKNHFTVRKIRQFCKSHRINLICSNNYRVSSYAVLPAQSLKIPSITIIQDFVDENKLRKFNAFESTALITVSDSVTNSINKFYKKKIYRIYNGLDTHQYIQEAGIHEKLGEEFPILRNKRVIGMIAQIVPVKGHKFFFRAMKRIADEFDDVMFFIIGDSPQVAKASLIEIKNYVTALHLEDKVIFAGPREDVPNLLKSFDLLVVPSSLEPFGRVVIESMVLRVPVVATMSGGPSEIIQHDTNGLLVPVDNEQSLTNAVRILLTDDTKRKMFGEKAQKHIQDQFDLKHTVVHINQVVSEVLSK